MAFDWIRVVVKTPSHPKVQRLEKLLGIEDGLGCAVRLWCWTAAYAPEGEVERADVEAMARAVIADVPSLRNAGVTLVTESLVTAGLVDDKGDRYEVHDWLEYQAAHADKAERDREQNRERQRRFRNRKRNGGVTVTPAVTDNVTVTPSNGEGSLSSCSVSSSASQGVQGEKPAPRRPRLVSPFGSADPHPQTTAVLAALFERGLDAAPPGHGSADRVEAAIKTAGIPAAVERLAVVYADPGAPKPLTYHVKAIRGETTPPRTHGDLGSELRPWPERLTLDERQRARAELAALHPDLADAPLQAKGVPGVHPVEAIAELQARWRAVAEAR